MKNQIILVVSVIILAICILLAVYWDSESEVYLEPTQRPDLKSRVIHY